MVNSARKGCCKNSVGRTSERLVFGSGSLFLVLPSSLLLCAVLLCSFSASAQPQQSSNAQGALAPEQPLPTPRTGTISGTVVDRTGAIIPGAHVQLARENSSLNQEATSDADGQFFFSGIAPGPFQLTVTAPGFTLETASGTLEPGEDHALPPVVLDVAPAATAVKVAMTPVEIAEAEIKDEEKQRVLGVIPNFYVTYNSAAAPLNPKQKFELAWKATIDPINFGLTGAIAGVQQAANAFGGYGQGAQGYAKRYGASYADSAISTFIGGAILPSVLKQDPRYFYKGTGTRRSRFFYAIATAFICKGDNGHWQANYSSMLGSLAAGGLSNLYYPESDRDATVTFENTLVAIGSGAATSLLQEFVVRKLTRNPPTYTPATTRAAQP
ncbi:MAG: carboxypeptidase regulatory-like domain-containing protein [Acidobacteria bacterium]|nr:MAG: carboxypeptidase regulatory-like domain-containing protein [Acidobacteriota bacterium]